MTAINPGRIALQAHIFMIRLGMIPGVIALLLLLGAAPWIGFAMNARDQEQQEHTLAQARQELRTPLAAAAQESVAEQNLRKFHDVLGDRSESEQYLKTMFAIAAQTGLSLDQGEYQWQVDRNSATYRYQILLPVKGSYGAIRRFCEKTLLALPFVTLDQLSFKRESVGEDELDASLRFTLFLTDMAKMPPLLMKPAMPVPLSPALSPALSQREKVTGTRYARFTLNDGLRAAQAAGLGK